MPLYSAGINVYLSVVPLRALWRNGKWPSDSVRSGPPTGGAMVSTGMLEAMVAGRGAAGLVKSGIKVIANNDYDYAYAA